MSRYEALDEHILNIVQNHEISEQIDLQQILKKRGYHIPQATLSRRMKKLNIAKVSGIYKIIELPLAGVPIILNIQVSECGLIVMHTHPGNANSLAYYFDQKYVAFTPQDAKDTAILGTLAGDDTVLLILKSRADVDSVLAILRTEFPYLIVPE